MSDAQEGSAADAPTGTVYLIHLDPAYKHARHYTGKPQSSRFLNGRGVCWGGEFAELASCPVSAYDRRTESAM